MRKMQKGICFFKVEIQKNVPTVKFAKCELVQFCVKVTICTRVMALDLLKNYVSARSAVAQW